MILAEIQELKEIDNAPFKIKSRSGFKDGLINVNHKLAIKIEAVASYYDTTADISVYDANGLEIAVLCFTKHLGKTNWRELTKNQFIAFLTEASFIGREDDFEFNYDYLILNDSQYEDYKSNYKGSSSIWGGFVHSSTNPMRNYKKVVNRIEISSVELENNIFSENAERAIYQPFAHERFLKLYHLLELRFDLDVINEIKKLDFEIHPEKIGKIFTDYSQTEFLRLKQIIENNCSDISRLVSKLNLITNHQNIALEIFYKFGKTSNPLKSEIDFSKVVPFGFEENILKSNSISFQANHPKFIKHLASYWIYRIRCCIAHNKIGEYILSHSEEEFIAEFAEPLIKEVIIQSFKK